MVVLMQCDGSQLPHVTPSDAVLRNLTWQMRAGTAGLDRNMPVKAGNLDPICGLHLVPSIWVVAAGSGGCVA